MGAGCKIVLEDEDDEGQKFTYEASYICEDNYGQTYVDVEYDKIVIHPDYSWQSNLFFPDLALARLSSPVTTIEPVEIDQGTYVQFGGDEANLQGQVFTVVGAGWTEGRNKNSFPERLQQVDVPFVPQSQCAAAWNDNPDASHWDTELCAGVQDLDACNGKRYSPKFELRLRLRILWSLFYPIRIYSFFPPQFTFNILQATQVDLLSSKKATISTDSLPSFPLEMRSATVFRPAFMLP